MRQMVVRYATASVCPCWLPWQTLGRCLEEEAAMRYVRQNQFLSNILAKFDGKGISEQTHTAPGETGESCNQGHLGADKDL